jgi:hypothetical protein
MRSEHSLPRRPDGRATELGFGGTSSPRFPFSLVYRVLESEVEVLAVAHGKRRPGYWRSRLPRAP